MDQHNNSAFLNGWWCSQSDQQMFSNCIDYFRTSVTDISKRWLIEVRNARLIHHIVQVSELKFCHFFIELLHKDYSLCAGCKQPN